MLSTYYTDLGTIKIISFVLGHIFPLPKSFTDWPLVRIRILDWSEDLGIRSTGLVSESTVRICFRIPFFSADLNPNPHRNYGSGFSSRVRVRYFFRIQIQSLIWSVDPDPHPEGKSGSSSGVRTRIQIHIISVHLKNGKETEKSCFETSTL